MNHLWNEQYISNRGAVEIKDISNILHESFITRTLSDICNLEKFPKLCTYNKKISLKRNLSHFIGFKKSWQNK